MRGHGCFDPQRHRVPELDGDFCVTPMPADWPDQPARWRPGKVLLLAEVGPSWLARRYCSMVLIPTSDEAIEALAGGE